METFDEKRIQAKIKFGRDFPAHIPKRRLTPKSSKLRQLEKLSIHSGARETVAAGSPRGIEC